jgi:hypothetical protein
MKKAIESTDPDIMASLPALRRAAQAAHKLAKATGTPMYVLQRGRVVDINPVGRKRTSGRIRKNNGRKAI